MLHTIALMNKLSLYGNCNVSIPFAISPLILRANRENVRAIRLNLMDCYKTDATCCCANKETPCRPNCLCD